jgi:hypothetical protein
MAARPDPQRREQGELVRPKKWCGEDDFWHDLAAALGQSVAQAQLAVSEEERSDWLAYQTRSGPISLHKRLDILFARLELTVLSANGVKKQNGQPFELSDRLIQWQPKEEPEATPEAVLALLRSKRKP